MRRLHVSLLLVLGILFASPDISQAIPAFARKYGFNCNMCHTVFAKLNDFGQRVRDNGYQMPGQEGREKNVFQTAPPVALRTSTGLIVAHAVSEKGTTSGFRLSGLDLLAAGVMHRNISFLMIYTPRIDEPSADYTGNTDGSNPGQPGALESANIIFSNLAGGGLNIRLGRFEPGYHAFSSKRSIYLLQPYEVYAFTTPNNSFVFDDNQIGLEVTGHFRHGFKYAAGVINGTGASPDNNNAKDFYAGFFKTFGRGDGQSAGQRVGAFAYYGWQPTKLDSLYVGPSGEADGKANMNFYRVGCDLSCNWNRFNLMGMLAYGVDDKALNDLDSSLDYTFSGGFARLDWTALYNNRLVASIMYNWVNAPCYDSERDISAFTGLLRYYLGDWTAVNVALHGEYTYRETGHDNPYREHNLAALIDFAF
ncbi:MAG: hypothetical protein OEW48_07790 [Phycisphaerae bacterium]|nr:hypothetical protein [Phycisphaerae bacterium]